MQLTPVQPVLKATLVKLELKVEVVPANPAGPVRLDVPAQKVMKVRLVPLVLKADGDRKVSKVREV